MKKIFFASILMAGLTSCISDVEEISGSCTVILKDGTSIEMTTNDITHF
jgi:SNF family Na+-dependent transporter